MSRPKTNKTRGQRKDQAGPPQRLTMLAVAVAVTLSILLIHAGIYWFLTDDAFISFRYARNLSDGHGLVFNPGHERVEGYTNFLWVLVLAAGDFVGVPPHLSANVLSLAATVGLWALVVWFAFHLVPAGRSRWLAVLAPLFLAVTRSVAVWSTSGLETRLFELLVVGGAFRLIVETQAAVSGQSRRPLACYLLALATLTRPDGLLISGMALLTAAGYRLAKRSLSVGACLGNALPFILIVGAHVGFRWVYYNQWLPNTYYAKVDGQTHWDLGKAYLAMFAVEYMAVLWIPLLIAAVREHWRRGTMLVPMLFAAIVVPHMLYVASVGGDHFEFRPVDLYFPLIFLLLVDGVRRFARPGIARMLTGGYVVLVLIGLTLLPWHSHRHFPESYQNDSVGLVMRPPRRAVLVDPERDALFRLPGLRQLGQRYQQLREDTVGQYAGNRQEEHRLFLDLAQREGVRMAELVDQGLIPRDLHIATHSMGAVPYYSDLRFLDRHGLTDAHVAHTPFTGTTQRLGHAKMATLEYAQSAGVELWASAPTRPLISIYDPMWVKWAFMDPKTIRHLYAADMGSGFALVGLLLQGHDHMSRRMPKVAFKPVANSDILADILTRAAKRHADYFRQHPNDTETETNLRATLAALQRLRMNTGKVPLRQNSGRPQR